MKEVFETTPFRAQGFMPFMPAWSRFFNEAMGRLPTALTDESALATTDASWSPRVDVKETPENYVFTAEAPGLKAEDIRVQVTTESITISGERKAERREENDRMHLVERSYGSFSRSFTFPAPVDDSHVDAVAKDGILTVKVMKAKTARAKKIAVKQA